MNEKISLYERRRRLITTLYERQNDTVGNLTFEFCKLTYDSQRYSGIRIGISDLYKDGCRRWCIRS